MTTASLFTKPWFIASIIVGCFAIITPKIFVPLFRQIFGLSTPTQEIPLTVNQMPRHARASPQDKPNIGMSSNNMNNNNSTSKTLLGFILPIYAFGIAIYMFYTLFRIYGNKKTQDANTEKLLNDINTSNIKWDPLKSKFINNYENNFVDDDDDYECLDRDYVEFLKNKKNDTNDNMQYILTNMKESLNNINLKLIEAEKSLDLSTKFNDSYVDSLKLQLAQTELQMSKLIGLMSVPTVSKQQEIDEDYEGDDGQSSVLTASTHNSRSQSESSLNESLDEENEQLVINKKQLKIKKSLRKSNEVTPSESDDDDDDVEAELVNNKCILNNKDADLTSED